MLENLSMAPLGIVEEPIEKVYFSIICLVEERHIFGICYFTVKVF